MISLFFAKPIDSCSKLRGHPHPPKTPRRWTIRIPKKFNVQGIDPEALEIQKADDWFLNDALFI